MRRSHLLASVLAMVAFAPGSALGITIWDEGVDGDLSGVMGTPDTIVLGAGANTIIGSIGNNGNTGATNGQDADYFTFALGGGLTVTSITVDSYTFSPGNPGQSFFGYVAGTGFAGQGGGDVDAFTLFNAASGDLVGALGGPYGAGNHAFWIQETSSNVVNYEITFTAVPEPAAGLLVLGAFAALAAQRRR